MKATASSSTGGAHLQLKTNQLMRVEKGSQITIKLNDKYYIGIIQKFLSSSDVGSFELDIEWKDKTPTILPSGTFDVEIVYKNEKVFHSLISPSV
ncbi:MAG: hypothetical protein KAG04_02320 [Mycoplasmataceae bacterium]|nr:hypothetical protein [Mycoplasmataceae bacterium]